MPNIKSAKKRVIISEKAHIANSSKKSALRKLKKSTYLAIENKDADASAKVDALLQAIDIAASQGLLHKNKAARDKSRLVKALRKIA